MECDGCGNRSDTRPLQDDFPLIEFASTGWAIGQKGDLCPSCLANGKKITEPCSDERLQRELDNRIEHCQKYHGRLPQSPYLAGMQAAQ
jgi:hypothetical protein